MYNVHTCDHATCPHFHHPLWDTFATSFFIMIFIDTINMVVNVPLLKYYCSNMLWLQYNYL
jgi:hypothetical protein